MKLLATKAFKVFNSKAEPTIAIAVKTKQGRFICSAPSGSSIGKKEVKSYKSTLDNEIIYFNSKIASAIRGFKLNQFEDFRGLEHNLTKIGGNPIIALEFAMLEALAASQNREVYEIINPKARRFSMPLGKVIGGGAHSGYGDIQEYLFSPETTFTRAAEINAELYHLVREKLTKDKLFQGGKDAEGGWLTSFPVTNILSILKEVKEQAEVRFNCNIKLGIDLAATRLFSKGRYRWSNYSDKRQLTLTKPQQLELLTNLIRENNIEYIEDPFEESDMQSFVELSNIKIRKEICADDLTCTNPDILKEVIKRRAATAVIIKPNQIGSLIKTKEFVELAKKFGLTTVVSHRSGSTTDTTLAHLALGFEADYFKCGIAGGERIAQINELIRLESKA